MRYAIDRIGLAITFEGGWVGALAAARARASPSPEANILISCHVCRRRFSAKVSAPVAFD
jgi:hypothetical protein